MQYPTIASRRNQALLQRCSIRPVITIRRHGAQWCAQQRSAQSGEIQPKCRLNLRDVGGPACKQRRVGSEDDR